MTINSKPFRLAVGIYWLGALLLQCRHKPTPLEKRVSLDTKREVLTTVLKNRRHNEKNIAVVVDAIPADSLDQLFATDSTLAAELRAEVGRGAPLGPEK